MGTIEDIAVGVYHHVFQINLDRDLTLDIVLMGHGTDVSILVVTFLMGYKVLWVRASITLIYRDFQRRHDFSHFT